MRSLLRELPPTLMTADGSVKWATFRAPDNTLIYRRPDAPDELTEIALEAAFTCPAKDTFHETGGFSDVYRVEAQQMVWAVKKAYYIGREPDLHHGLSALRANIAVADGLERLSQNGENIIDNTVPGGTLTRYGFSAPKYSVLCVPGQPNYLNGRSPALVMDFVAGVEPTNQDQIPPIVQIETLLERASRVSGMLDSSYIDYDTRKDGSPHYRNFILGPAVRDEQTGVHSKSVIKIDSFARKPISF